MEKIKVTVRAKLNLSLNVFPNTYEAYHRIDSVVTSVDISDTLTVEKRSDALIRIETIGADIDNEQNIAFKTATAVRDYFNLTGINVRIEKGIPMAAGLGGSSADGAGVAYALAKLFGVQMERVRLLINSLGSDFPYMTFGGLARLAGYGERFTTYGSEDDAYTVLLFPCKSGNLSRDVYQAFDKTARLQEEDHVNNNILLRAFLANDLNGVMENMGNSLLTPAMEINPNMSALYRELKRFIPHVNMTGSGSMLYTLCDPANKYSLISEIESRGISVICTRTAAKGIDVIE